MSHEHDLDGCWLWCVRVGREGWCGVTYFALPPRPEHMGSMSVLPQTPSPEEDSAAPVTLEPVKSLCLAVAWAEHPLLL